VTVRGDLYAVRQASAEVFHERASRRDTAVADRVGDDQLRVGIERRPRPYVASVDRCGLGIGERRSVERYNIVKRA
jgi:hypothetical protein